MEKDMQKSYHGIKLNYDYAHRISEHGTKLLADYYCRDGEDAQMAFARAARAFCGGDMKLAQRIYDYASRGWFMFASPVLSNAPAPGESVKSLPISCFLSYVPDSLEGLIDHTTELRWLSVKGGGVGGHWSAVRAVSDIAPGPIPFLNTVDSDMTAYRQGKTRKGSYAAYLDIDHPDIVEFLNIRVPTGDTNRKCLNLHHAVNLTDDFMRAVRRGEDWNLVDPNDRTVRETIPARKLWETILETRFRTGEPYILFIDTANEALPIQQKNRGLKIHGSNLCLSGDTRLHTILDGEVGEHTLEEVISHFHAGRDVRVLSYDIKTGASSYEKVTAGQLMDDDAEVYRIEDEATGNVIECTGDHKVWTKNRGYVMAQDLNEDDELLIG